MSLFALQDLFRRYREKATGVWTLGKDPGRTIYIDYGDTVFAQSTHLQDRLTYLLVERGKLTQAQMDYALANLKPGLSIGKNLIEMGFITQRDLLEVAKAQVERIVRGGLTAVDLQPEFQERELDANVVRLPMNTPQLFLAGTLSLQDREGLLELLGPLNQVVVLQGRNLMDLTLPPDLAAWLRTRFQVNLVSAEQIPFNEFLLRVPEISYVSSVRMEPLGALAVLQLDLALAPPIIDLLLGGEGRDGVLRELTDIEESILASVVEIICRELTAAWQPVGLSFNFERRQMQTQVARIMSVTEKTLCLSFEIRMPHSSGLLNLAFPAVVANTILRRLTSDWARRRRHGGETRERMEAAARRIRFGASLQLPTVRLAASEIENLEPGTVLNLNMAASTLPEWRVGGQALLLAQAIRQGAQRAARIERHVPEAEL